MDILGALDGVPHPTLGAKPCVIRQWLDEIPEDTPGRDRLVNAMTIMDPHHPDYRRLTDLDKLTRALGFATSIKSIGDHRSGRCRCP